jgi:microcystin degradation protein MlrC
MTSCRVRRKIFATGPPEGQRVHIFLDEDLVEAAVAEGQGAVAPLTWGKKVRGVRVTLSQADEAQVEELLTEAWKKKAPARLHSALGPG